MHNPSLTTTIEPQQVASDLCDVPNVVVMASDLPTELRPTDGVYGLTGAALTHAMRNFWRQDGHVVDDLEFVLINNVAIATDVLENIASTSVPRRALIREQIASTVLHELAHVATLPRTKPFSPNNPNIEQLAHAAVREATCRLAFQGWCKRGDSEAIKRAPTYVHHSATFLRTLVHLAHRFRTRYGLELPAWQLWDPLVYGMSGLWRFQRALGDEPEQLLAVPISELSTIPTPFPFQALFDSDVATLDLAAKHIPRNKEASQ